MQQIVDHYQVKAPIQASSLVPMGGSASPKRMVFHMLPDNAAPVSVLDIGFGTGSLGELIKGNPETRHWSVDGIDGFAVNCHNAELLEHKYYRNIWHGLAQELPSDLIARYDIICLLDVIEHLTADTARWLLRSLLTAMGPHARLFISTPLWFMPQDPSQEGDLEAHQIGIPVSSMMALVPKMYAVTASSFVGGFVYEKNSLNFVEFFQPTADRSFDRARGEEMARAIGFRHDPGVLYRVS
jgi:2-polyprenyl-3-methyl-5-hydroxy-6-metoxy-1,4-benzoquinol methylase